MSEGKILYRTWSVCPACLKRIPAERVQVGENVFLKKCCDEHGATESIIWRGFYDIYEWISGFREIQFKNPQCPDNCGLCSDHLQKTCCIILNVTSRCNLNCNFCLADNDCEKAEPTFEEIKNSLCEIIEKNKTLVQLSGGEATMRDDLPDIIKAAKQIGAKYVQLNSNGIRLGEEKQYVHKLAEAGLSFVFMQFDGTSDEIYNRIRGRSLFKIKQQAIENCAKNNIGVTLVPTIVRNFNSNHIGEIIRFAVSQSPKVRGVHFQPATYTGRIPEAPTNFERITLDELLFEINRQTEGLVNPADFLPSCCDHPLCGFHGDFVVDNNKLFPLLKRNIVVNSCCCNPDAAIKNREFVARRWQRPEESSQDHSEGNLQDMEYFLKKVKTHGFTITSMAFQDAGNIDFSRLRNCSLHVYNKGRIVPFCSYFLSAWK
jgi:7,8-dihydro-6-hydroxymethylpterin dimethyltransferase